MKQKIYIKLFDGAEPLVIKEQGDWIDLRTNKEINLESPKVKTIKTKDKPIKNVEFDFSLIPLGVGMILPKGMEAHVLPRSSTFKKFNIILANSCGIIDNSYCGEKDEWKFPAIALGESNIPKGTAIAQFRIIPSQRATFWQRLKWLLSSGVELIYVSSLERESRGGFGSTGDK